MPTERPDTTGRKRFAFRDVRTDVELLASGRPPKSLRFLKKNPVTKKLSKLANKVKGSRLFSALKAKALPLAAKAALGPVGGAIATKIAGKYGSSLLGRLKGPLSSIQQAARLAAFGVKITEELNPNNIRRPRDSGDPLHLSASASAAGKELGKTIAASVTQSLVSGIPLASGLPPVPRIFKTASSLVKSPRFFNPNQRAFTLNATEQSAAEKAVRHVEISTPDARLYPQAGLLEDDIVYRLTLLAENVYAPTKEYAICRGWGAPEILGGFCVENSGTSQHERGEAVDITINNNPVRCFQLAQWMRDNILYDQLILCHDVSGGGQVWIHVSFNINARRREVLTKTFNDTFVEGLHIYRQASGTDTATTQNIEAGETLLEMLADRQLRLQPVSLDSELPQQSSDLLGLVGTEAECGVPDTSIPNKLDVVNAVYGDGRRWNLTTDEGGGLFTDAVVKELGEEWGHIRKSPGVTQYNGHAVDAIMYKSPTPLRNGKKGQVVDIIASHGSVDARPAWLPVCDPVDTTDWFRPGVSSPNPPGPTPPTPPQPQPPP